MRNATRFTTLENVRTKSLEFFTTRGFIPNLDAVVVTKLKIHTIHTTHTSPGAKNVKISQDSRPDAEKCLDLLLIG